MERSHKNRSLSRKRMQQVPEPQRTMRRTSLSCCSSRRLNSLLIMAFLFSLVMLLPPAALGRPQALSTGDHESKGAALPLPRKQEQLHQIPQPEIDDLHLEQILSRLERRSLSGPGSSPPQCTSKCGRCLPCRPVHVPIQPGLVKTAEYYPEAWRCKCGNKLFMP